MSTRRYTLFLLFAVSVFNYVDRTIISILQVPIKRDLGLSDAQLGALTGLSFAIVYATLCLPVAALADRGNRTRIIAASLMFWSAMTAFTGLATSFVMLVLLRFGVAAGEAGSVPSTHSVIADLYPPERRATVLAVWGLSLPAGMAAGYLLGGNLDQWIGWRAAFAFVGVAGLLLGPVVWFTMREPPRGRFDPAPVAAAPPQRLGAVVRHLWQLRTFRWLAAAGACHAYAQYSIMNWNAPFYARVHGMPLAQVSLVLALMTGIGMAVGMVLGGRLSDHHGQRSPENRLRVVAIALLGMVPLAIAQYLVASPGLSVALGLVASTLMMCYYGPIVAVPQLLVPSTMRAFTSAVVILTFNLFGLGLGPFVTGWISDVLARQPGLGVNSIRYALCSAVLFSLAASLMFWRASRHLPAELLVANTRPGEGAAPPRKAVPARAG
ncbi:spinster family MFS transporter [Aquabacterium sp.]|uniref:spinster family MFS transporter n=1 Tax=Aquabacterium sp. TaxID=1872578 RepID=UPI002C6E70EA|nr:MFS transporter [Aquabacterium sp.]HSW06693.1 MFS transporter [Aquabacterium sp.]